MLTWVKISHSFYNSCRLSWFQCARQDPFGEVEKGKDLQVFCLMCENQDWSKWHKCGLPWDKLDLAEELALFIYKPINKPLPGQHTRCVKPQESCFARGWALLPSLKSPGRAGWTGKALWLGLHWVVMCWWAVGILTAVSCGERKGGCMLLLCTVWSLGIFQDYNSGRKKNLINNVEVRGEGRGSEGKELLARTALFFSLTQNSFCYKS